MNNHNDHNENTPNTPQADASQLSEDQQILLTAEALGQLEPDSDDARKAAEIHSGQHYSERKPVYKNAELIYIPLSANGVQSIIYDIWSILHALFSGHKHLLIRSICQNLDIQILYHFYN
mgnify:CR=1 FL=1